MNGPASTTGIGKPSLGRDPKSRARSRDYLKQYALDFERVFRFSHVSQMPARNTIPHLPPSVEPIALSTTRIEPISSSHSSQCSLVRPDGLQYAAAQTHV